ncbi:hypothetical protein LPB72_10380 [Hydrogenophaga crassostreae]|uniref:Uncharacterized protein n=1 Tax=Hydrogenophaga crassostreae TaxID=1763535 RepID=A0A162P654_9BURK|nr:hypothetical protein LPB072_11760 [Hydrogenophaga crassostreae]OAD41714.1 hypothetical protein LPB72_10380 [Hydrogenophaga crassostreae]
MRWIKPSLRNSISALLSSEARQSSPEALEPVRLAMLNVLGREGAVLNPRLHERLMYLHDAHALWYARSDVVATLCKLHGEAHAVSKVHEITPLFRGLLPKSLTETARMQRA